MARPQIQVLTIAFSLLILVSLLQFRPSSSANDPKSFTHGPAHRGAMILPLFLSPPNSSTSLSVFHRRHLQRSLSNSHPNARMRLYDDLLLNGYYTTRLLIGTPPQRFALIVDTGSTVTYVPCSTCEQCGKHQDPRFQPELSSTYRPVRCNIDCNCDSARVQCTYERQYAEMSTSSGVLGEDIISFGNQSDLVPEHAVFGCETLETGDLYSQHADGIMGLGRGDLSVVDQLVDKGVISNSFSLCYGGMDIGGGAMVLGGLSPPEDMVFAHSDPVRSPYYNIELKEIHVAGKALPLSSAVFDGKHGTVLDSGTTYAYLPEVAFVAFKHALVKELGSLKLIRGPDPNYNDICFSGAESDVSELSKTFPDVDMVFSNGHKLSLSPENYLFRHSKVHGAYCLGVFQNGKDPTTLLGGIVVRNTLVTYDREHSRIGFWKTNCSELWERLHIFEPPPPAPLTSDKETNIAPTAPFSPNESSSYLPPGVIEIGLITFDMSLSIKYSDLKPHITELTGLIAREIEVNTSQVDIVDITSKGNGSSIKCTIFPAGSDDHISNATAMSIIARLAEHRVQLPVNFGGSYQLLEWKVEPPKKQTWWKQNHWAIVAAIVVTSVVGSVASGAWFLRRQRKQSHTLYEPVDPVPEQELQPL